MLAIFGSMRFNEIPGQHAIRARLLQAVKTNRVSHALMLSGSPGCGHYALALALAQYLQCTSPIGDDSCGVCPACHQAAQFVHPDIHFVFPVARTAKIKDEPSSDDFITEWRQYLTGNPYPSLEGWYHAMGIENKQAGIFKKEAQDILRKLNFKSFQSDYKVIIFWMPEKMNTTAANKLLKIIEEPADHTVFLFVTCGTDEVLPTILSRTQLIKVPKIGAEHLYKKLAEEYPGQEKLMQRVVQRSQGDYLLAREMIDQSDQNTLNRDWFIRWMRISFGLQIKEITDWVSEVSEIGRERQKWFLQYALSMIRNNFMVNQGLADLATLDEEESAFSSKFNAFIHPGNIEGLMEEFDLAIAQVTMNANPKILLTDMSLQIHRLLRLPAPGAKG
ncbi:MAG: DNA polymerase III subunit delta [Porphyromonadaceae bacterium]|nr:MAG: DNA polymerase III subunit delta [Porphyromonadaceae bacterium]